MYAYARRYKLHAPINNRQECEQTHRFPSALHIKRWKWVLNDDGEWEKNKYVYRSQPRSETRSEKENKKKK